MIFREYSKTRRKFLSETLKEDMKSVVLEKQKFQNQKNFKAQKVLAFVAHQNLNERTNR